MITTNDLKKEVREWANKIELTPKQIHIRTMKNKWASCSSKGRVTLSDALLSENYNRRAEVIVHELLHLRYPKHNKMFNTLLVSHLNK